MDKLAEETTVSRLEAIEWEITVLRIQEEQVYETYKAAQEKYLEIHGLIRKFEWEAAKLRGEEV